MGGTYSKAGKPIQWTPISTVSSNRGKFRSELRCEADRRNLNRGVLVSLPQAPSLATLNRHSQEVAASTREQTLLQRAPSPAAWLRG